MFQLILVSKGMPKYRRKKKPAGPYDGTKRPTNAVDREKSTQGSDNNEEILGCDSCKADVDNIVQCEKCLLWLCCDCESISPNMFKAMTEFQSLHWYCEKCATQVKEMLSVSQENRQPAEDDTSATVNSSELMHKRIVSSVVEQLSEVIRETKDCIKKAISESFQIKSVQDIPEGIGDMDVNNPSPPSLNHGTTTANVLTTFINEEKERGKRRFTGPDLQIEAWVGHFECVRNSFTQHWSGNQKAVLSTTSMQSMVLLGGLEIRKIACSEIKSEGISRIYRSVATHASGAS